MFRKHLDKRIYIIIGLAILAGFFEGIGILTFIPLLKMVGSENFISEENSNFFIKYYEKIFTFFNIEITIFSLLSIIIIIFFCKGFLNFIVLSLTSMIRGSLLFKTKKNLYDSITNINYSYFQKKNSGYFINIINEQVTRLLHAFTFFSRTFFNAINIILYLILFFIFTPKLSIIIIITIPFFYIVFHIINKKVKNFSLKVSEQNGVLSNFLIESLTSLKYFLITNNQSFIKKKTIESIRDLTNFQIKTGVLSALTQSLKDPLSITLLSILIFFQLYFFEGSIESVFISLLIFYRAFGSIHTFQSSWQSMLEHIGSLELIDFEMNELLKNKITDNGNIKINDIKSFQLSNVNFKYEEKSLNTLNNISLRIEFPSSVAFIGESGAGKSTLIDILAMQKIPTKGDFFVNGINSNRIEKMSYKNLIGFVNNESFLINDTIFNNIAMKNKISKKDIIKVNKVAKISSADLFINSLPLKFNTKIGYNGLKLSAGQRQRIFIARELFRDPKILFLDEATNSIDDNNEKEFHLRIRELSKHINIVMITHKKVSTIYYENIFLLGNGKITKFNKK